MSVRPRPSAPVKWKIAALCRGSTKDFESFYPGSIPGAAAKNVLIALLLTDCYNKKLLGQSLFITVVFPDSSTVERAAVNR